MERHETMKPADFKRIGAACAVGFAALMLTMSATPAAAEACAMTDEGSIPVLCGSVLSGTDPVGGVTIEIRSGTTVVAVAETLACADVGQPCGTYTFLNGSNFNVLAGTYTMCVAPDGSGGCGDTETIVVTVDDDGNTLVATVSSPTPTSSLRIDFNLNPPPPPPSGPGTGTPGYWKNHPEAWPGDVVVGGVTYLNIWSDDPTVKTKYTAIKLMGKVGGDKTITMFSSLISAKLNGMIGNDTTCVDPAIAGAEAWMVLHKVGTKLAGSDPEWSGFERGEFYHQQLDSYNNGLLSCAHHRD